MDIYTADELSNFRALGDDEVLRRALRRLDAVRRGDPEYRWLAEQAEKDVPQELPDDRILDLIESDTPPHDGVSDEDLRDIVLRCKEIGVRPPLWAAYLLLTHHRHSRPVGRLAQLTTKRKAQLKVFLGAAAFKLATLEGNKRRGPKNRMVAATEWLRKIGYTRLSDGTLRGLRQKRHAAHVVAWYVITLKQMLLRNERLPEDLRD